MLKSKLLKLAILPTIIAIRIKTREKYDIVFDLDLTLIKSIKIKKIKKENYTLTREPDFNYSDKYFVWSRPYSHIILKYLSSFNNLYIYTAAGQDYCDKIVSALFKNIEFKKKYYRQHLDSQHGKNLDVIFGNDYNNSTKLLVDDKIRNYTNKNNNFYKIKIYKSENDVDRELLKSIFVINFYIIFNKFIKFIIYCICINN